MSSRAKKSAALQDLKSRRSGHASGTRVEDYQITKEDDVYDKYDEDEYREVVKRRGEREDFVVDDGKLTW
jgi:DNA polymerase alpha subunit A